MSKGIFVTATGTDVGKTYVCGLLVKKVRDFGIDCGYYKPVLSGLERIGDKLIPGDAQHVLKTVSHIHCGSSDVKSTLCLMCSGIITQSPAFIVNFPSSNSRTALP